MRHGLIGLTLLVVMAFPSAAMAKSRPVLGIGEQQPTLLSGPLFDQLGFKQARLTVNWDDLSTPEDVQRIDTRMQEFKLRGLDPLVVFSRSYDADKASYLPTLSEYKAMFSEFRSRYPWVRQFATWNEVNLYSQPSARNPGRIAQYYRFLKSNCSGCTILAAVMLDTRTMVPYAKKLKKLLKGQGRLIWGMHNYSDVMRARDKNTRSLIRTVKSDVWIVETGCLVRYSGKAPSLLKKKFSERLQAKAYRFIMGPMVKRNPRIKRVYLYQWQAGQSSTWDSGLLRPNGQPRPAYSEVRKALKAKRFRMR